MDRSGRTHREGEEWVKGEADQMHEARGGEDLRLRRVQVLVPHPRPALRVKVPRPGRVEHRLLVQDRFPVLAQPVHRDQVNYAPVGGHPDAAHVCHLRQPVREVAHVDEELHELLLGQHTVEEAAGIGDGDLPAGGGVGADGDDAPVVAVDEVIWVPDPGGHDGKSQDVLMCHRGTGAGGWELSGDGAYSPHHRNHRCAVLRRGHRGAHSDDDGLSLA